jgi:tripeptidyl-peptidase-1
VSVSFFILRSSAFLLRGEGSYFVLSSYIASVDDGLLVTDRNLCNAYMQLSSRGVTILFSSGDGGVAGTAPHGEECKNFLPTFPSGCPYVTSVGSTHSFGPEKGSNFSSGGFSTTFKVPSWQEKAVSGYLEKIKADGKFDKIKGLFDESGRGFPDLALQGEHYQVVVGGKTGSVSGTSASTPVFAAIVSMLNAELSSAGKKPVGFLNPLLYSPGAQAAFNDVTTGRNPGCKTDGFWATDGWDAVTGFGTPKYQALRTLVGLPA